MVVSFGEQMQVETLHRVKSFAKQLDNVCVTGLTEYVPTFTTVAVFYNALETSYVDITNQLRRLLTTLPESSHELGRAVEIPVCYGGELGPDLETVAQHNGLSPEQVITIHTSVDYLVYMVGFSPGFPYLGGMPPQIATPRLSSPRLFVPAGSVGIAGNQTGVYPTSSPGGWQLIGRTPLALFRPKHEPPSLLSAGDIVRFRPISYSEYQSLYEESLPRD